MDTLILIAKAGLSVMLLLAAGGKLADLPGFAAAVRLFVPGWTSSAFALCIAVCIVFTEFALGISSLSLPSVTWLNTAILALGCGFFIVTVAGYIFHRGRSCRCFGALSRRKFDAAAILRSVMIAGVAAVAVLAVPNASREIGAMSAILLCAAGFLTAVASFSAARTLDAAGSPGNVVTK